MLDGRKAELSVIKTFAILTGAAAAMACLLALLPAAGHDQLWFLYIARQMLHGARLYGPQIFDPNPPLIAWLMLLPTEAARLAHLPATLFFKLAVVLLEAAIAAASLHLLRRVQPSISRGTQWSLAFAFIAIFAIIPARDFGQRDHLLALLTLPYLIAAVLALPRPVQSPGAPFLPQSHRGMSGNLKSSLPNIAIALTAGIGLCLKPHYFLIPIAIELYLILKTRSLKSLNPQLRPTPWVILLTALAYLAAIRILTPTYLSEVVPFVRQVYWAIGNLTLPQLIAQSLQLHLLAVLAIALYLTQRHRTKSALTEILLIAGAAATAAYYLQGTGWYYQQLPAISFFALALWLELIELASLKKFPTPAWLPKAATALAILALALTTHFMNYPFTEDRSYAITTPDPTFFTALPPQTPIAILTLTVDDSIPPLFHYDLQWSQRTNNLWALPAILRKEDPQATPRKHTIPAPQLAELDRLQHAWMVEDLTRNPPQLLLIERCQDPAVHCQTLEDRHDNLLAWFQRDPAFRALFAHYQYQRSSGPYDAYIDAYTLKPLP